MLRESGWEGGKVEGLLISGMEMDRYLGICTVP